MKVDLTELYEKVTDAIWAYQGSNIKYLYGKPSLSEDGTYISFEVYVHSNKPEISMWTEYWTIHDDGKIIGECNFYIDFEEFKNEWF